MHNSLAVVRTGTNPQQVVTFVRPDAPGAPDGCELVRPEDLAPGWVRVESDPPPVPDQIESRLLRRWLILHGHSIASIDAAIDAIVDSVERELTRNEWEYATSYTRRHPMFPAFVRATGLSDEQIDQAFREAAGMS